MRHVISVLLVIYELLRGVVGIALTLGILGGAAAAVVLSVLQTEHHEVKVPRVRGKMYSEAEAAFKQVGLRASVAGKEYDPKVPAGRVVRCKPYEGKGVKPGRVVECFMSLGPNELEVPKLTGLSVASARERADEAGLQLADIRRRADSEATDTVLEQYPAAGEKVPRNTRVVLVASGGPDFGTYEAPDGETWRFRRVRIVVPRGEPLQRVQVIVEDGDGGEDAVYDRVHKPGDEVTVKVSGRGGWRVRVLVLEKEILNETL